MILTEEQIKADDETWKYRNVKQELKYIGYAIPARTAVTNDYLFFVACMARKALQTIEALERQKGHWIKSDKGVFLCSVCNSGYKNQPTCMGKPMFEFCPMCGADMRGKEDG